MKWQTLHYSIVLHELCSVPALCAAPYTFYTVLQSDRAELH